MSALSKSIDPEIFWNMWENKPSTSRPVHTPEVWNIRAEAWNDKLSKDTPMKARTGGRVAATAKFLREHGLLGANDTVIDIGCGPGRFVAEFAKSAKWVTGTDFSDRMIELGAEYAASSGCFNTNFVCCDFLEADIDELNWRGAFDLVFSCTTPAMSKRESAKKASAMSRGWVFNGNFMYCHDELAAEIAEKVFHEKNEPPFRGNFSYALFNLLWLDGYSPYITYFIDESTVEYTPERSTAQLIANRIRRADDPDSVEKIYAYLSKKADAGENLSYLLEDKYIWLLWNTGERENH